MNPRPIDGNGAQPEQQHAVTRALMCSTKYIMRVTDVLCLSAVTVHGSALEWLDAMGLDARPSMRWTRRLLHGTELRQKKPAKCVKELHNHVQQHANTHGKFIKLCWHMDKHAISAERVITIDETSFRLFPVQTIGWGRRGAQLQSNTRELATFTAAFKMDCGPLDMLLKIVHAGKANRLAGGTLAAAHVPRHIGQRLANHDDAPTAHGHTGRRDEPKQGKTIVHPSLGHGQHPRQRGYPGRHEGRFPSRRAVLHRAKAEAADDDDEPMPDALPNKLIEHPPAPASAPGMSNLERCIALHLVYGAGLLREWVKQSSRLAVSCVGQILSLRICCLVCWWTGSGPRQ